MDGAARFNQRDSLATILITGINIIAGLLIGTLQQGIELSEAARTYTVLTVGDGLVTLISVAAGFGGSGITLTRANSAGLLGGEIRQQLLAKPVTLYVASLVCGAMCLIPGLPKLAFLTVSALLFFAGRRVAAHAAAAPPAEPGVVEKKESGRGAEFGSGATAAPGRVDPGDRFSTDSAGGRKAGRATAEPCARAAPPPLRRDGLSGAPVHISDNLRLRPREYLFSLRGMEIGRWQTEGTQLLAVSGEPNRRPLAGKETREPAFGVPAIWIAPGAGGPGHCRRLLGGGRGHGDYHASGRINPPQRLVAAGPAETKRLMDSLNESHPKLLEELVPKLLRSARWAGCSNNC